MSHRGNIKSRIERLETQTRQSEQSINKQVLKPTDSDIKRAIQEGVKVGNDNIEWDLSLLSDEMLDRLEQYVIKQERQGEK